MTGSPIRSPSASRPARSAVARRASPSPAPSRDASPFARRMAVRRYCVQQRITRARGARTSARDRLQLHSREALDIGGSARVAGRRKPDPKGGSPPMRALHVDLPAIRLDRPTRDGKAEANPIPRARLVDSIEAIEDALAVLGADARAGVDHLDGGPARLPSDEDAHASPLRGVLDRVVDEVDEGTAHDHPIGLNVDRLGGDHRDHLSLLLRQDAEVSGHLARQLRQVHTLPPQHDVAPVCPRECQQALHHAREPVRLLEHAADHLAVLLPFARLAQRDLPDGSHGGQWRSQLVRGIRRETPKLIERSLETSEHRVEHGGELTQLVLRILRHQALTEAVGGDGTCALRHIGEGGESTARQRVATQSGEDGRERKPDGHPREQFRELPTQRILGSGRDEHDRLAAQGFSVREPSNTGAWRNWSRPRVEQLTGRAADLEPAARHQLLVVLVGRSTPGDAAALGPLEHPLRNLDVVTQIALEMDVQVVPQEDEHATPVERHGDGECGGIPDRQTHTDTLRSPRATHASSSRNTKPMPRSVWMRCGGASWSTFLRKRAMCTSITLSSGVARDGSFHTSRANIARDTGFPRWRIRYSRSSNSREVSSSNLA